MSDVWNPAITAEERKRVADAIAAAWDDAMEVGCMEHGGYAVLAEAAILATRGITP